MNLKQKKEEQQEARKSSANIKQISCESNQLLFDDFHIITKL